MGITLEYFGCPKECEHMMEQGSEKKKDYVCFHQTHLHGPCPHSIKGPNLILKAIQKGKELQKEREEKEKEEKKRKSNIIKKGSGITSKIVERVSIIKLAKEYGLEVYKEYKGKAMAICPFHNDHDPSLSLNEDTGLFHCFGCKTKGNIIEFIKKMERLKLKNG